MLWILTCTMGTAYKSSDNCVQNALTGSVELNAVCAEWSVCFGLVSFALWAEKAAKLTFKKIRNYVLFGDLALMFTHVLCTYAFLVDRCVITHKSTYTVTSLN